MILLRNDDILIERREKPAKHRFSLLDQIYVEKGSMADWEEFHALHYKAERLGIWPRVYRIGIDEQAIGCIVFTVPRMTLSGRNTLMKHIAPNQHGYDTTVMNKYRAKWLNAHTATLSRIVLDPMYRGVGVAYRAMNVAMRMTGYDMIEFQSSMSRVNPFAQKAGITFAKPKRNIAYPKGLDFFRRWFECIPTDFVAVYEELRRMLPSEQEKCLEEMRVFYYKWSCMEKSGDNRFNKRRRIDELTPSKLIKQTQQLAFSFPMYGVYINPDKGRKDELARRVPIGIFDRTPLDKPLNLELCDLLLEGCGGK